MTAPLMRDWMTSTLPDYWAVCSECGHYRSEHDPNGEVCRCIVVWSWGDLQCQCIEFTPTDDDQAGDVQSPMSRWRAEK